MIGYTITKRTLPEAYHEALTTLWRDGVEIDCPAYDQKQRELPMTIEVLEPAAEPRISKLIIGGPHELMQYELELVDGILDFIVGKADNLWEYTYHQRYAHQLPFVLEELKRDKYTRRAVMSIRDFDVDSTNEHPACLQSIQFFIRPHYKTGADALDRHVLFRSNDLPEAFYFNAFALTRLQEKVAEELGTGVGTYTHRSNSMHVYEKDYKMFESFAKKIEEVGGPDAPGITYAY
ncbi:MAG: thymidylate synthase, partial [Clostridiales Family XIII bacterium]|nr:thymidylate synthase [Clostridiales Family XIII bacterium]